jgi:tRNA pseudouridine13 synthase
LIPAAPAERTVGILWYATPDPPCKARAKATDADFVVEEWVSQEGLVRVEKPGYYPLYKVEKHSIGTLSMAEELSEALKSRVSFGGLKDKRAEAVQYVTPTSLRSERPLRVDSEKFTASLVGYLPKPMSTGAVVGNKFEITLRECCSDIGKRVNVAYEFGKERRLPNYFGMQRFGSGGLGTHEVGKAIVKRDFENAVRLLLGGGESDGDFRARVEALEAGRLEETLRFLPPGKDVESGVARTLARHPGDWVGALRAVPIRLRRLYVQAYQSFVFNKTLSEALRRGEDIADAATGDNWAEVSEDGLVASRVHGVKEDPVPGSAPMIQLLGYAHRDYGSRFDSCLNSVVEEEGVGGRDFYISEMQEVSAEGGFRRAHVALADPSSSLEGESARLEFTLSRGQYATVLLREVVKASDPAAAGLA